MGRLRQAGFPALAAMTPDGTGSKQAQRRNCDRRRSMPGDGGYVAPPVPVASATSSSGMSSKDA